MKSFVLLPLLAALATAQLAPKCQCPQVKCPTTDAATLCNCFNNNEIRCKQMCPDYVPTILPCPTPAPPPVPIPPTTSSTIPRPTFGPPKPPACVCENMACPMDWPRSCYCLNGVKQKCYEKCGGEKPELQTCPPLPDAPTLVTSVRATGTAAPQPSGTNPVCGGGRGNYRTCAEGWTCIKNPYKPGCGPECDGLGVCVEDKLCGGFAGFACRSKAQVCVDDPRDDCDPKNGGADCGGLCMWEEPKQEEE